MASGNPPENDSVRLTRLRRMKALATGLLVAAAVTYLLTLEQTGVLGFVNAGAEAAMVGALADWFAVTAIFRHPLGLPIPHTALIRTRKDTLGASLEEFVSTNFLSEPVVRDKLARAEVVGRLGTWLAHPPHAEQVCAELAKAGDAVLERVRDDDVVFLVEHVMLPRIAAVPAAPVLGSLLDGLLDDGSHQKVLELGLDELIAWLHANQQRVEDIVLRQAPVWTPAWLDERVARRVHRELTEWLTDVRTDRNHQARAALDDLLRRFARDLREDPQTQARVQSLAQRLLDNPEVRTATLALWTTVRRLLIEAVQEEHGELRKRLTGGIVELGERLGDPTGELRARAERALADLAGYAVRRFSGEIATVISDTVQRWDADDASRRIELYVGRDLQFIRINGTVVGALAGLAIHTVTVLIR